MTNVTCYWDRLLAKQTCPRHGVPVAECPVDLGSKKFQDLEAQGVKGVLRLAADKLESLLCECGHPITWHDCDVPRCTGVNCSCMETNGT